VIHAKIFSSHMVVLNSYNAACDVMEKQGVNYACRPRSVVMAEL
jgi:hypothetical protein